MVVLGQPAGAAPTTTLKHRVDVLDVHVADFLGVPVTFQDRLVQVVSLVVIVGDLGNFVVLCFDEPQLVGVQNSQR